MNNGEFSLKEKDMYKLFNEVKLEESEFNDIGEEVSTIEKERIKKNLNKRMKGDKNLKIIKYSSSAAAVTLACLIGLGAASPTFAKNVPGLNSIMQTINDKFGYHGDYAKYSEVINKSVTDNGISLTINEVIADDSKLIISYTIESDKKIDDLEVFGLGRFIKINGKYSGSHGTSAGNYINECTYVGSEEIHTDIPKSAKKFNIDLNITDIANIIGKWNIAFSASKEEICKESTVFKPNKKLDFADSIVNIEKVVFSPIDTSILLSGNYKDSSKKREPIGLFDYDYWIVFDDRGVELKSKGIGGSGNSKRPNFNAEMDFVKLKHIPSYLTVIPCKIDPIEQGCASENGEVTVIKGKKPTEISETIGGIYPIELSQGKMGKLIIKEIKTENGSNGSTVVKYTAEGKAPYFQAKELRIKNSKGEDVKVKDRDIRKDEEKPNEFTMTFEALDANEKYIIYTNDFDNVEFKEDLKFTIELNK